MVQPWKATQPATTNAATPWAGDVDDDDYTVMTLRLNVPLDHEGKPSTGNISLTLHASLVYGKKKPTATGSGKGSGSGSGSGRDPARVWNDYMTSGAKDKPFLAYLCGGPGDDNGYKKAPGVTKFAIERGYQVLFLDYRGTGGSDPFPAAFPVTPTSDPRIMTGVIARYLAFLTQDQIVQDFEAVRLWLSQKLAASIRFTLLAQSFGGWIAITYLSRLPSSLKAVLLTAAMPPFAKSPREVYTALYKRVVNRNEEFYREYPDDGARVLKLVTHLHTNGPYPVPGGRYLTAQTVMTMGRTFGALGGFRSVHDFLALAEADLDEAGSAGLKPETIALFAGKSLESFRLHQRPVYGLLQEAIYCHIKGMSSSWAAVAVGKQIGGLTTGTNKGHESPSQQQRSPKKRTQPGKAVVKASSSSAAAPGCFSWMDDAFDPSTFPQAGKLYFSGEMVLPAMFDFHSDDPAVTDEDVHEYPTGFMAGVANTLATKTDWADLYDVDSLRRNALQVPVRALVYKGDMYVDWEVSVEMAKMIGPPCEVVVVGLTGDGQIAVSSQVPGGAKAGHRGEDVVEGDMRGQWYWAHGAVKGKGKTEKVLGFLLDGVAW